MASLSKVVVSHLLRATGDLSNMSPSSFVQLLVGSLFVAASVDAASPYGLRRTRSDVLDCLTSSQVPFVIKSDPNWSSYATPYNLRLVYEPAVITIPETPLQVACAVKCAAAAGIKVQAKGGGHSYASYSSGGQDGSLIVDMEKFSSILVDPSEPRLRILHHTPILTRISYLRCKNWSWTETWKCCYGHLQPVQAGSPSWHLLGSWHCRPCFTRRLRLCLAEMGHHSRYHRWT